MVFSRFCLIFAQNRIILKLRYRFKSNKRSHSGDDSNEDPPVPIPNTEVKLVYVESTYTSRVGRIESCRISIKKACFSSKNRLFSYVFEHLTNFFYLVFDAC